MDFLLAAYTAWALAWMVPLWLGSYLYRSLRRTFTGPGHAGTVTPLRPAHLPTIHLAAA